MIRATRLSPGFMFWKRSICTETSVAARHFNSHSLRLCARHSKEHSSSRGPVAKHSSTDTDPSRRCYLERWVMGGLEEPLGRLLV